MTTLTIDIIPFQDDHQPGIDILMTSISKEFPENIFSPQSAKDVSRLPTHKYWVAQTGNTVIGTIGLLILADNNIELKRMFVNEKFRGQDVAKVLLETVINSALDTKAECIYLGTMTQFKAAQAFYEKNGFIEISQTSLPKDFSVNPVDKIFYKKVLK